MHGFGLTVVRIHIVPITGDILSPAARRFLETTGCEVLEKPFAKPELVARIGALLARPAARNN